MSRFRLRIMFQNVANYLILFVGIFFIMVMLAMAVGMPDTLDYYKKNTDSMMFATFWNMILSLKRLMKLQRGSRIAFFRFVFLRS